MSTQELTDENFWPEDFQIKFYEQEMKKKNLEIERLTGEVDALRAMRKKMTDILDRWEPLL